MWKRQSQRRLPIGVIFGCGLAMFLIKVDAAHWAAVKGAWPYLHAPAYWADFLMPVVLFLGCMAGAHRDWPGILSKLAPYSFGIYLCHPIFLDLAEITLQASTWPPIGIVITKIGFAMLATSLFVRGLKATPAFAWTVGLGPLPNRNLFFNRSEVRG